MIKYQSNCSLIHPTKQTPSNSKWLHFRSASQSKLDSEPKSTFQKSSRQFFKEQPAKPNVFARLIRDTKKRVKSRNSLTKYLEERNGITKRSACRITNQERQSKEMAQQRHASYEFTNPKEIKEAGEYNQLEKARYAVFYNNGSDNNELTQQQMTQVINPSLARYKRGPIKLRYLSYTGSK